MASIQINRGNSQEINNTPITDGLILFNTTNKTIYMDNENTRDVYSGQLSNSSDVEIVNLSDGQIIIWDETNNKWKNTDRYFEINNLTDVNLDSLVNGQILKYDETSGEWINTDYAINDLSNVNINLSTLADGQIIVYNATTEEWENSEVKGGHKILNDSGTTLTQKDNLQFKGTYVEDDQTNNKTVVNVTRQMTLAEFNQLTAEQKKGIIDVTDQQGHPITASDVPYDSNNTVKDKLDSKVISYVDVTATTDNYGHIQLSPQYVQNADVYKVTNVYALANNLYCVLYPYISSGGTPLIYVEVRDLATNARQPNLSVALRICGLFD